MGNNYRYKMAVSKAELKQYYKQYLAIFMAYYMLVIHAYSTSHYLLTIER